MDYTRKYLIFHLFCYFHLCFFSGYVYAQSPANSYISKNVSQLKQISTEMNQEVLSLLSLIKEYEKLSPSGPVEMAKIISPFANVNETDNENSITIAVVRLNEEYAIMEKRENWIRIKTENNREGWIQENYLQIISKAPPEIPDQKKKITGKEASVLLSQISGNKNAILELYETASHTLQQINEIYNGLPHEKKKALEADYNASLLAKEKIEKYYDYATRFLKPFDNISALADEKHHAHVVPGERFKGTALADIGKSSYTNMGSNSTISRRLGFNGIYQIDPSMSLEAGINHQNELIQTPFSNTTIETGISKKFEDKLQLNGKLVYENYNDKTTATNTFGLFNTGINLMYNPSKKSNIYGNINFRSKDYNNLEENNYQGVFYTIGTSLMPKENKTLRFQVLGTSQFSERDFFRFNQINPTLNYMVKQNPKRTFNLVLDIDLLKFASTNNSNDYQKYKMELKWRINRSKKILMKNLNLIYKSYPFNELQDYARIGYNLQRRKGSAEKKSSSSSFSTILTYVVNRDNMMAPDQFDLRWDKSNTGPAGYFNINIFNRLWNNFVKSDTTSYDNVIDFYSEFGPNIRNIGHGTVAFTGLKIGLIFGGHIYYNFSKLIFASEQIDEEANPFKDTFFRNGSSIRGGIGITSEFKIKNARLELAGSYERSLVLQKQASIDTTGTVIYGDNLMRKPSSFQFRIDFRLPLYKNWDIHFNLSNYSIRTDATMETSINPIEKKSNLRLSGGLIYRFAL
jgi:hypothetical protein